MYIHVKVIPESKKESFEILKELHFVARVIEEARRNQANQRVVDLVSKYFGINKKDVRLISGYHSQSKLFSLPD